MKRKLIAFAFFGFLFSAIGALGSHSGFSYEIKHAPEVGISAGNVLNAKFLPSDSLLGFKLKSGKRWLQINVKSQSNTEMDLVLQLPVNDILTCTL